MLSEQITVKIDRTVPYKQGIVQLPQSEAIRVWNGIIQASVSDNSIAAAGSGKKILG